MQVSIAKKGDVVIDSKLGIYFLKKYADFTVWIKSSSLARAKRVAKRDKLALKDAMRIMKEKERTERRFFKGIYGIDTYAQEKRADLSLDTTNKSPRQLAAIVIKALKKDKIIP
jgi:cytidylate kinase